MGAGPSIKNFKPIENAIYVGCNRAVLYEKVKFDYLFAIDKVGIEHCKEEFANAYEEYVKVEENFPACEIVPSSKLKMALCLEKLNKKNK